MGGDFLYKVIVSGFDPFDKLKINPSMELVKSFESFEDFQLYPLVLPTVYGESSNILIKKIEEIKPDLVLSFGVASKSKKVAIERFALNIDDAGCKDNREIKKEGFPITQEGPQAYLSGLPLTDILRNLRRHKIKSRISNFAGTFVCNNLMYSILHYINENNLNIKFGFIHIPKMARGKKSKFMSLEKLTDAAKIIIRTSI